MEMLNTITEAPGGDHLMGVLMNVDEVPTKRRNRVRGGRGHERLITHDGKTKPIIWWASSLGISREALIYRIRSWGQTAALEGKRVKERGGRPLIDDLVAVDLRQAVKCIGTAAGDLGDGNRTEGMSHVYLAWRFLDGILNRAGFWPEHAGPETCAADVGDDADDDVSETKGKR